ncbi:uroporphyrinogen-III C-methyltransferase [Corynebacterium kroppenstedtii]|uniref:uroporphyrinogen-III C-methyltransferase n=1 Tax=Corynebacterium sp. PCR 32 TaxID=3351342 RepID=UPI0030976AAA
MTELPRVTVQPLSAGAIRSLRDQLRGTVALVGGGPGDPGLVSYRGHQYVGAAEVILLDHLAPDLSPSIPEDCDVIDVAKLPYQKAVAQDTINSMLVEHARAGKFVVRLKGGDPFVFGRGLEEQLYCENHGIQVIVVPGITSPIAVPESAGVSVTQRGVTHEFTVVSGHVPPGHPSSLVNWEALGHMAGTICLIMAVKHGGAIARALIDAGRDPETPALITQEGTTPNERSIATTLASLGEVLQNVEPPAVIVIGHVAAPRTTSC